MISSVHLIDKVSWQKNQTPTIRYRSRINLISNIHNHTYILFHNANDLPCILLQISLLNRIIYT